MRINNQGGLIEIKEEKSNMDIKRRIEKTIEGLKEKRYELEKKIVYTEINTKQWYYLKGQFDFLNWLEGKEEE